MLNGHSGSFFIELVEESPHARLAVEESDHSFYVIHVSDEPPLVWASVKSGSPIFAALEILHSQWKLERLP